VLTLAGVAGIAIDASNFNSFLNAHQIAGLILLILPGLMIDTAMAFMK